MLALYLGMLETEDEQEAFSAFYEKHQGRCLKVALAITRNHEWAEDAVHNAFLRMIRGKEKYFTDPRKSTGTLIVLLVKYEAIGILVLEKRFDHAALEDMEPVYNDDEQDVFRVVVGKATVERLQYHVSQLDAVNRGLFQMKHMRNKTDGEIADEIGLSKNAVAIRLHKIRKKLLEKMREEGYVDE